MLHAVFVEAALANVDAVVHVARRGVIGDHGRALVIQFHICAWCSVDNTGKIIPAARTPQLPPPELKKFMFMMMLRLSTCTFVRARHALDV